MTTPTPPRPITDEDRADLRELQQSISAARTANVARVRSYKNMLIGAIVLLIIAAVSLPFIVPITAMDLGVIRASTPPGSTAEPLSSGDVATIEIWGAVGGLIGLIVSLRKLVSTRA